MVLVTCRALLEDARPVVLIVLGLGVTQVLLQVPFVLQVLVKEKAQAHQEGEEQEDQSDHWQSPLAEAVAGAALE